MKLMGGLDQQQKVKVYSMPINFKVQLCGAKARQNNHQPCKQPAIKHKARCRLHGGLSTGAKTVEGKKRSAKANFKHGRYTYKEMWERKKMPMMMQWKKNIQ
jgi:hypothetical protein